MTVALTSHRRMPAPTTPRLGRRSSSLALGLAFVAMFASAPGQSFLLSVFVDDLLEDTGLSRTVFSTLYGLATIVSATVSLMLGRATDRIGLRVAWIGVAAGLACACLITSVASGLVLAFVGLALLRAFGQGSFPLLGTLIVNYWFPVRRGAAMAVASFGITAATIALPPLVALLIGGVGWQTAYRILAAVLVAVVLPLGFLLRRPPAATPAAASTAPMTAVEVATPSPSRRSRRLRIRIPSREAALLLGVFAAPPLVMTAITFHAVSLLGGHGLSAPAAAAALSVFGAASALATVGIGAVADRLSTRALLVAMSSALLAGTLVLLADSAGSGVCRLCVDRLRRRSLRGNERDRLGAHLWRGRPGPSPGCLLRRADRRGRRGPTSLGALAPSDRELQRRRPLPRRCRRNRARRRRPLARAAGYVSRSVMRSRVVRAAVRNVRVAPRCGRGVAVPG